MGHSPQSAAECAEFVVDRNVDVERLPTHRWKLGGGGGLRAL
jgi:hypothetical protein